MKIEKRKTPNGEWEPLYQDWSEAKTRRKFFHFKSNLLPGQAMRLLASDGTVVDQTDAPRTRLTPDI